MNTIDSSSSNPDTSPSTNTVEKLDDNSLLNKICHNQVNDLKSVGSNHSTDETLTATERGDEEDEDMNMNINDELNNTNEVNDIDQDQAIKTDQKSIPKSNSNKVQNHKSLMDKIFHTTDSSLRNFKIPKQTRQQNGNQVDKSISPGLYSSSSSSSSSSSNRSPPPAFETNIARPDSKSNTSFSSSNSPLISSQTDMSNQGQNKAPSTYYHPKKNQFRQYMMENSNSNSNSTNKPSSSHHSNSESYFNRHDEGNHEFRHSKSGNSIDKASRSKNGNNDFDAYRASNIVALTSSSSSGSSGSSRTFGHSQGQGQSQGQGDSQSDYAIASSVYQGKAFGNGPSLGAENTAIVGHVKK